MLNLPTTNFELRWYNEYEALRVYISSNPTSSRMVMFESDRKHLKEPTTLYTYLVATMDDPQIALQRYNNDIKHNPHNAFALYNRATLKHEVFADFNSAQKDLDIALELEPSLILCLESRNLRKNTLGIADNASQLICFQNKDNYMWLDYDNMHYILAAEADLKSPISMQTAERTLMAR